MNELLIMAEKLNLGIYTCGAVLTSLYFMSRLTLTPVMRVNIVIWGCIYGCIHFLQGQETWLGVPVAVTIAMLVFPDKYPVGVEQAPTRPRRKSKAPPATLEQGDQ